IRDVQEKSPFEIIQNNGKFGVARVSIENIRNKALRNLFVSKKSDGEDPNDTPKIIPYAAYTSYTADFGNDTYWPWVNPDKAFLFVAFKVKDNIKVDVRWNIGLINGNDRRTEILEALGDSETGESLDPDYWYFAWWNPEQPLSEGLYKYDAMVKPTTSNKWNRNSRVSCRFEVTEEEIERDDDDEE
ncbi:MAG TPA: hypothetical protein VI489_03420, partial [Candidatus Brocadiaceae bacterium]